MVRVPGRITVVLAAVLAGLTTTGNFTAPAAAREGGPTPTLPELLAFDRSGFVGSWRLTVFPPGGQPPHAGLATFAIDGTLTAADVPAQAFVPAEAAPPVVLFFSGGHGAWEVVGKRTAAFTFDFLIADQSGNAVGSLTLSGTAALGEDRQTIDAEYTATLTDPVGNVLSSGPGAFEGTRIEVESTEP